MATKSYKQDLPPKGGYAPINFKRIPARTVLGGKLVAVLGFGHCIAGLLYLKYISMPNRRAQHVEKEGFRMALQPLLLAERDRAYIKEVKKVRDAEVDLMSDVKDWEVGTWFGEKVYKTVPENQLLHYYSARTISPEFRSHYNPKDWTLDYDECTRAYI